jgi:hypothetical protein
VVFGHQDRLAFLVHPQLWLVPVGLIALAAEPVNRGRLRPAQALGLRYAGLLLVCLSSTADLFLTGLGRGVQLPLALALLSVAGVLLGTLQRMRAFLILGVTSLSLDLFAQIWHAAVGRSQAWAWWASGIVLRAAVLTLFALSEKRRDGVLRVLDALRRWRWDGPLRPIRPRPRPAGLAPSRTANSDPDLPARKAERWLGMNFSRRPTPHSSEFSTTPTGLSTPLRVKVRSCGGRDKLSGAEAGQRGRRLGQPRHRPVPPGRGACTRPLPRRGTRPPGRAAAAARRRA